VRTTVILVNYNGAADTAECLMSLLACPEAPFVVVVDNTPDDPELEGQISFYPLLKLIRAEENLGFGRGNNLGIDWALKHVRCEFIFVLNNDTTIRPDCIQRLEAAMDDHPEAGVIASRIVLSENPDVLWYGGGEVDWKRGGGKVPGFGGSSEDGEALRSRWVTFASGCAMFFRSEVLRTVGGFDERYFMYEEDVELSFRVQEAGWRIWYESSAVVEHRVHGSTRIGEKFVPALSPTNPNLPFYAYHITKGRLLTMLRHARGMRRWVFGCCFPAFMAIKTGQWVLHGRWDALRALVRAFMGAKLW